MAAARAHLPASGPLILPKREEGGWLAAAVSQIFDRILPRLVPRHPSRCGKVIVYGAEILPRLVPRHPSRCGKVIVYGAEIRPGV